MTSAILLGLTMLCGVQLLRVSQQIRGRDPGHDVLLTLFREMRLTLIVLLVASTPTASAAVEALRRIYEAAVG